MQMIVLDGLLQLVSDDVGVIGTMWNAHARRSKMSLLQPVPTKVAVLPFAPTNLAKLIPTSARLTNLPSIPIKLSKLPVSTWLAASA